MKLNDKKIDPTDLTEFATKYQLSVLRHLYRKVLELNDGTKKMVIRSNDGSSILFCATVKEMEKVPYLLVIDEEADREIMSDTATDDWKD